MYPLPSGFTSGFFDSLDYVLATRQFFRGHKVAQNLMMHTFRGTHCVALESQAHLFIVEKLQLGLWMVL